MSPHIQCIGKLGRQALLLAETQFDQSEKHSAQATARLRELKLEQTSLPTTVGKSRQMPHKFRLGQLVRYVPPFGIRAPNVDFTIVRLLPETEYRIKAKDEPNERVARERDLRPAIDPDRGL